MTPLRTAVADVKHRRMQGRPLEISAAVLVRWRVGVLLRSLPTRRLHGVEKGSSSLPVLLVWPSRSIFDDTISTNNNIHSIY